MDTLIQQAWRRIDDWLWEADPQRLPRWRGRLLRAARIVYAVVRDLLGGELNLRAMSLVYTTLLSVVPLLAVSFSVLKAFGVHNQVAPLLRDFLAPFGERGRELADDVVAFVQNVHVGVLGAVGLALLIYTVVSLMHKIELALNFVWHVEGMRSFGRRASNFLSVILVGPVLVFAALGLTTALTATTFVQRLLGIEPLGSLLTRLTGLAPYLLVWTAFTLIYVAVPNTKVRLSPAALGGFTAAVLWQTASWAFTQFIVSSGRHTAIYSGFAIVILVLIWLYLNWLVLLVGALVAFYLQNPHYVTRLQPRFALSNRMKECLALSILYVVGRSYVHDDSAWSLEGLAAELRAPAEPVKYVVTLLEERGYLNRTADEPPVYLPAHDLATIQLGELINSVRLAEESRFPEQGCFAAPERVLEVGRVVETSLGTALGGATVRDLVCEPAAAESAAGEAGVDSSTEGGHN